MRRCLDGQQLSTSRVSLTRGALTHCLHLNFNLDFNFNFNTLSTPTPPQPACATITVRHTFTGQLSVHLFSPHSVETSTTDQLRFDHCTRSAATAVNVKCATMCVVNRAHCEPCTLCVVHTMRAHCAL